jgi:hypothetical protein
LDESITNRDATGGVKHGADKGNLESGCSSILASNATKPDWVVRNEEAGFRNIRRDL